ncbi:MAG: hypothetical protein SYC29_14770 [Planctomycetota bacterium]|nr:hypothetical protein [Planctomycetota bacterium]
MREFEHAIVLANWNRRELLMAAGFVENVTAHERWFPDPWQ